MSRILILIQSALGHVETMAQAIAEGAGEAGAQVDVKRVPEEVAEEPDGRIEPRSPVAMVDDLAAYDAIIVGVDAGCGRLASPMARFLGQAASRRGGGGLDGKVGSVFASSAAWHGGEETTLMEIHANLLRLGMIAVGLPSNFAESAGPDEMTGGGPFGAARIAGSDGFRQASGSALAGARFQGRHVAGIANRLFPCAPATETEQTEHFMLGR